MRVNLDSKVELVRQVKWEDQVKLDRLDGLAKVDHVVLKDNR